MEINFYGLTLSAEQGTFLATRPHPARIDFISCSFDDGGLAFVEALEKRQSSLGSLTLSGDILLNEDHMKRLLKVPTIDHLSLSMPDYKDLGLLPFSAPVNSLYYETKLTSLLNADFTALHIATKKLVLRIQSEDRTYPTEASLSLLRRVAELGHFVELGFDLDHWGSLVRWRRFPIASHKNLSVLRLPIPT
jgi:hypothetical protein